MKSRDLLHVAIPSNVAVQAGFESQSSLVPRNNLVSSMRPCEICQYMSLTLRDPVGEGLQVASWPWPWNGTTILCGVISIGHSKLAPVECKAVECYSSMSSTSIILSQHFLVQWYEIQLKSHMSVGEKLWLKRQQEKGQEGYPSL